VSSHTATGAAHYIFALPSSKGITKIEFIRKASPVGIEKDEVTDTAMAEVPHNIGEHTVKVVTSALEAAHPELAEATDVVDTTTQANARRALSSV